MRDIKARSPQNAHSDSHYLFPPSWQGLKQQVIYLAQFGGGVQVIGGCQGAGKTTFVHWLLQEPDSLNLTMLTVQQDAETSTVFIELLEHLGLRPHLEAPLGELLVMLRGYVQNLYRDGVRAVVALDNAHWLADAELAALLSVIQEDVESGLGLHLILLAEPGLVARIDQLQVLDVTVHDASLPAFSPSEVGALLIKLAQVQSHVNAGAEQAQKVWGQSKGIPGAVIALLNQPADVPYPVQNRSATGSESSISLRGWPVAHFIALIVLCAILLWVYLVQGNGPEPSDDAKTLQRVDVQLPNAVTLQGGEDAEGVDKVAETTQVANESVATLNSVSNEKVTETLNSGSNIESDSLGNDLEDPNEVRSTDIRSFELESEPNDMGTSEATAVENSTPDSTPIAEDLAASDVAAEAPQIRSEANSNARVAAPVEELRPQEVTGVASKVPTESERKLLSMPENAFVLQLMAISALDTLQQFVVAQPNRDNLLIYRARRNGKLLYILVEGFYADKAAASAAINNLPSNQRKAGPWPKKLDQIQRDIRDNERI